MAKKESLEDILGIEPEKSSVDFDPATLEKIAEMNPDLLGGRTKEQFLSDMKKRAELAGKRANEREAARAGLSEGSFALPMDVDQLAMALENKYNLERKELEEEIKRLTERQKSLKPRYRDMFMDRLLEIDANLVSPKTGFVLKDKKVWLDEVGFSVELFIQHGRKRRSGQ